MTELELKEFLLSEIRALSWLTDERFLSQQKELTARVLLEDERKEALREALLLQAVDCKEHFLRLNNEYTRIDKVLERSVQEPVCNLEMKEIRKDIESLVREGKLKAGKSEGVSSTLFAIITVILTLMTIAAFITSLLK